MAIYFQYRPAFEQVRTFSIFIGNNGPQAAKKHLIPGFKWANATWHLENAIKKEREVGPQKYKITVEDKHNPYLQVCASMLSQFIKGFDKEAEVQIDWISRGHYTGSESNTRIDTPRRIDPQKDLEEDGVGGVLKMI